MIINGNEYVLTYTIKRIEMIESITKSSLMAELINTEGMLGIGKLKTIAGLGLKGAIEGAGHLSPTQGQELAEAWISEAGYAQVVTEVYEALERDCPFLFRAN